jgi:hypothetical protein
MYQIFEMCLGLKKTKHGPVFIDESLELNYALLSLTKARLGYYIHVLIENINFI